MYLYVNQTQFQALIRTMMLSRIFIVVIFSVIGSEVADCHVSNWDYRDPIFHQYGIDRIKLKTVLTVVIC